jgi:hypothetical protein
MEGGYRRKRKSSSKSRTRRSISRSRRLRQIKRKVASVARKLRSLTRSPQPRNRIFIIQRSPRRVPQIYIPTSPSRSSYKRSVSSKGFFRPAVGPMKADEYQIGNRYYSMQ